MGAKLVNTLENTKKKGQNFRFIEQNGLIMQENAVLSQKIYNKRREYEDNSLSLPQISDIINPI